MLAKETVSVEGLENYVSNLLENIQKELFVRASKRKEEFTKKVDNWDEFKDLMENKGGFAYAHWDGTSETEQKIKELTKATIRCIPLDNPQEEGKCIYSGQPSAQRVLFAVAY